MNDATSVDAAAGRRRAGGAATLAATVVCAGLVALLLVGCGQKGPLALPGPAGAASATAGSGAAR
jgi:predicted small lipoprotein YifL